MRYACDTSVLVAALDTGHVEHAVCAEAVQRVSALPAHVLLETYSVLTRLPHGASIAPEVAFEALKALPWETVALPPSLHLDAVASAVGAGRSGGAVYDALIGVTAAHHGLKLLTRDRRASAVYRAVGVDYAEV